MIAPLGWAGLSSAVFAEISLLPTPLSFRKAVGAGKAVLAFSDQPELSR
jgi:hypothetical protein